MYMPIYESKPGSLLVLLQNLNFRDTADFGGKILPRMRHASDPGSTVEGQSPHGTLFRLKVVITQEAIRPFRVMNEEAASGNMDTSRAKARSSEDTELELELVQVRVGAADCRRVIRGGEGRSHA